MLFASGVCFGECGQPVGCICWGRHSRDTLPPPSVFMGILLYRAPPPQNGRPPWGAGEEGQSPFLPCAYQLSHSSCPEPVGLAGFWFCLWYGVPRGFKHNCLVSVLHSYRSYSFSRGSRLPIGSLFTLAPMSLRQSVSELTEDGVVSSDRGIGIRLY